MDLYPYQEVGSMFLAGRKKAILADTMGLGKTAQAIRAADLIGATRIWVICPASVRINWQREYKKFSRINHIYKVLEKGSDKPLATGVNIISYELATSKNMHRWFMDNYADVMILDESHYLKNREAKRTEAILGIHCKGETGLITRVNHVWCLTGTPTPNHPGEIFSVLRAFGVWTRSYYAFMSQFCVIKEGDWGPIVVAMRNVPELKELVKPIMIRRKVEEVMPDLPDVTFGDIILDAHGITHPDDLAELKKAEKSPEAKLLKSRIEEAADEMDIDLNNLEGKMSTLRRVTGMAKIRPLYEFIMRELDSGLDKVVIGAIHRDVIEGLRQLFAPQYGCVTIYGGVDPVKKQQRIDDFVNKWKPRVLIGQVDAIAGIDGLQRVCSNGIFAECSWNPSNNRQLIYRLRRDGQTRPVLWRFASLANSLDEPVMMVNRRKTALITQVFD